MIDPKDFALSLGNPVATHVFIEKVNKEFETLQEQIKALEEVVKAQQVAPQTVKKAAKIA